MASISKRKNGSYCIRVSNGSRNGKQDFVCTTYYPPKELTEKAARKSANDFASLFETAVRTGTYVPGDQKNTSPLGMTVSEFIVKHYESQMKLRLSPTTARFYQAVISQMILPSFGKFRLSDVGSHHLQAFVDYLSKPGAKADGTTSMTLSAATVRRYATVFSSVMTEAWRMGLVEENRIRKGYVRFPKTKEPALQAYDETEVRRFLQALPSEPKEHQALLLTALLLGLRRGEIIALQWGDVDFEKRCLSVSKSAYKVKGQTQSVKMPKSVSGIRKVYFSEKYEQVLLQWKREQAERCVQAGDRWNDQSFIFTDTFGNMMSVYAPTRICYLFEKRNGLRHLKLHGLRHTCGSLLIRRGVDPETVREMLGHESLDITNRYVHPYENALRSAADMLEETVVSGEMRL